MARATYGILWHTQLIPKSETRIINIQTEGSGQRGTHISISYSSGSRKNIRNIHRFMSISEKFRMDCWSQPCTSFSLSCSAKDLTVRTRMWTLVGACIALFWIARLGSVHLPVGTRDGHA
ncbi:hypothetical protein CRG98_018718 [Punica granatum]|uniref:Uncharacterized protein n=1 Tax=Punica granatum TaxID=22663 RepID=A0A2I0JYK4_PUNGR|nr:hypothetical protein CRG98_018718 [Punica granatum]